MKYIEDIQIFVMNMTLLSFSEVKKYLSYDVASENVIKPYIKNDNPLVD